MKISKKIGFIGAGQMATALAAGFVASGIVDGSDIRAFDINKQALTGFQEKTGAGAAASIADLVQTSDILFLAVKPQHIAEVAQEVQSTAGTDFSNKLFVSIVAGIPIGWYEKTLAANIRLVRVMPNTPCLVGEAASGYARSKGASVEDAELVGTLLRTVGVAFELQEKLLNAVTGLSGSGPAFAFIIIEALADGGVKAGLPRQIALDLAAQTLKGSAEMYLKTREHPGALKDRVTSPAGTTIAGVDVLEQHAVRGALIAAVEAAAKRSEELGKQ